MKHAGSVVDRALAERADGGGRLGHGRLLSGVGWRIALFSGQDTRNFYSHVTRRLRGIYSLRPLSLLFVRLLAVATLTFVEVACADENSEKRGRICESISKSTTSLIGTILRHFRNEDVLNVRFYDEENLKQQFCPLVTIYPPKGSLVGGAIRIPGALRATVVGFVFDSNWNSRTLSEWSVILRNTLTVEDMNQLMGMPGILTRDKTVDGILGVVPDIGKEADEYNISYESDHNFTVSGIVRSGNITDLQFRMEN